MTIKTKEIKKSTPERTYPWLGIRNGFGINLFTKKNNGVRLVTFSGGSSTYAAGYYMAGWCESEYKEYDGAVEVSND